MTVTAERAEQAQYLSFLLAGEEYAVGILRVREIIEYDTLTLLPSAPPQIRGIINLRGSVVPVVDLAVQFGLEARPVTRRTCIVIVELETDGERTVMGLLADAVSQVIELRPDEIEPPPPFGTRVRMDHLVGMGRNGRKFVLILDIDRLLAGEALETVAGAAERSARDGALRAEGAGGGGGGR
jgi:purine-binding chemotaxis protein CheW